MDRGAWKAAVHRVAEGRTRLSNFSFTFHFHALEKEMATHSSVLAWRVPGTGEPGGLPSMGSHSVGHEWSDLAAAAAAAGQNKLNRQLIVFKYLHTESGEDPLEKEMAAHSSILAWRIPGTEEPGGLPSMGSHRVGHDWHDLAAAAGTAWKHQAVTMPSVQKTWSSCFHSWEGCWS